VIGWERGKISQRDAGRKSKWARIGMIYRIDVPARIVLLALKRSRTGAKCVKGACASHLPVTGTIIQILFGVVRFVFEEITASISFRQT